MMEFLGSEAGAENSYRTMVDIIETHNQSRLFGWVVGHLMENPLYHASVREENVWRLFVHLKIVTDCLDKVMLEPV